MDRRADPRIEVRLRCHAALTGNNLRIFIGQTENISRSGALVLWEGDAAKSALPGPGDLLTVDIELPAHRAFGQRCMHCEAVVTRVTAENGHTPRIALQISQMSFRHNSGRRTVRQPVAVM